MKKLLAMMLAAMMVLSLAACGNSTGGEVQKSTDTSVNNEQETTNEAADDSTGTESRVDLSDLEFTVAEEVFVDENGRFQGGLEPNNEEGAVLLNGSGVKVTAKKLADNEATGAKLVSLQIENNSGKDLSLYAEPSTINGYMVHPNFLAEVANETETEGTLIFPDKELILLGVDTLIDASFVLRIASLGELDNYIDVPLIQVKTAIEENSEPAFEDTDVIIYDENDIKIITMGLDREESIMEVRLPIYIENNTSSVTQIDGHKEGVILECVVANRAQLAAFLQSQRQLRCGSTNIGLLELGSDGGDFLTDDKVDDLATGAHAFEEIGAKTEPTLKNRILKSKSL